MYVCVHVQDSLAAEIEGTMRRELSVEEETAFEDQRSETPDFTTEKSKSSEKDWSSEDSLLLRQAERGSIFLPVYSIFSDSWTLSLTFDLFSLPEYPRSESSKQSAPSTPRHRGQLRPPLPSPQSQAQVRAR